MKPGIKFLGALAACALVVTVVQGCGSDKKDPTTSTGTTAINFTTEITPLVTSTCALSGCHTGSQFTPEATFKAYVSANTINGAGGKSIMPPTAATKQLTAAEKTRLLDFIAGK